MKLSLVHADRLGEVVRTELQQLVARINRVWGIDHDPQTGEHTSLTWAGSTQTTVGAAGGASALPATPSGYILIVKDGVEYAVPYYPKS